MDTVDREKGVAAAHKYLTGKGNAIWLKRQHSAEAHKNALWFTAGFICCGILSVIVMMIDAGMPPC